MRKSYIKIQTFTYYLEIFVSLIILAGIAIMTVELMNDVKMSFTLIYRFDYFHYDEFFACLKINNWY